MTMHAGEIPTSPALVARLLARQFPRWARLPIHVVPSYGTDHDIYRLGEHLVARLPRIGWATEQAAKEALWLPRLAPQLPLAVPVPVTMGRPDEGYPFAWAIHEWLPGKSANGSLRDSESGAVGLAAFITALRRADTTGAPLRAPGSRGAPLAELDDDVQRSIAELGNRIDRPGALRSWQRSLEAPAWQGLPLWVHGDLLPGNLLVRDGRLSAVIDFGGLNVGDPACDLLPAWNVFAGASRRTFLAELEVDEAARLRGRGWALAQAVLALPYYWYTNAGIVRQAMHAVTEVLGEDGRGISPSAAT